MSIDFRGFGTQLNSLHSNISDSLHGDLSNPENLLQLQQQMTQYQEVYSTLSSVLSDVKQTAMSIIQKF